MAVKIEQYQDRLSPNAIASPQAANVQFSDAVGQALGGLGKAGQQFSSVGLHLLAQQKFEMDQNDWSKSYSQAVIDWGDQQQKAAEAAPAGAPGFEETTKANFEAWAQNTLKSVANADGRVQSQAREQIERLRVQTVGGAQSFELKSRTAKAINDGQTAEINWNKTVAKDLGRFDEAVREITAMYDNGPLDPNLKHDAKLKAFSNLAINAYRVAIADPKRAGAALGELKAIIGQMEVTPEAGAQLKALGIENPNVTPDKPNETPAAGNASQPGIPISGNLPMGMRNRNPGNIKYAGQADATKSDSKDQGDAQASYATDEMGFAAMYRLALRKFDGGKTTIDSLIAGNGGWTPGNREAAASVARKMGIGPNDRVDLRDPATLERFGRALVSQEQGPGAKLYPDQVYGAIAKDVLAGKPVTKATRYGGARPETAPDMAGLGGAPQNVEGQIVRPIDGQLQAIAQYLPTNAVFDLISHAQTSVNQQNALWNHEFDKRVGDASASLMSSGTWTGQQITPADFERRSPGDGQRLYAEYQKLEKLGSDIQAVATMSDQEQSSLLASYAPTTGDGAKASIARRDELSRAIATVQKQRADDPAGYVLRNAPSVKAAGDALTASTNQPIQAQQAAATAYANASIAEQRRLGVLSPRLLTDNMATTIGVQFRQLADGGNNVANAAKQMEQVWGENWPQVFGEIYKDLPPVLQVLGTLGKDVDAATSALIASTASIKVETLKEGFASPDVKKASDSVQQQFAPLKQSMSWQVGGSSQFALLYNAAEKLTYTYMAQGDTPDTAAARAYNNTIGKNYNIQDNVRVPKQYDMKDVLKGADLIMNQQLPAMQFQLPPGIPKGMREKDAQAQYADGLKAAGVWITSGKEDGLILYDANTRSPVKKKDGSDVKFTWAQLLNRPKTGAGVAGEMIRPEPFFGAP